MINKHIHAKLENIIFHQMNEAAYDYYYYYYMWLMQYIINHKDLVRLIQIITACNKDLFSLHHKFMSKLIPMIKLRKCRMGVIPHAQIKRVLAMGLSQT